MVWYGMVDVCGGVWHGKCLWYGMVDAHPTCALTVCSFISRRNLVRTKTTAKQSNERVQRRRRHRGGARSVDGIHTTRELPLADAMNQDANDRSLPLSLNANTPS